MTPGTIGRYELIRPLGAGGMGEVFLAKDATLDRLVAIKRVIPSDDIDANTILHEARIVAALDHPNIAAVFDIVEEHDRPFVVMEYVEGPTLASRLASGALLESEVVAYGRQLADALAYAHERHVLHCDIKPSNVMLTSADVPKILDFGIARISRGGVSTTAHIRGTPAYMAPEVLAGGAPTPHSDIFSLGMLLTELATGQRRAGAASRSNRVTPRLAAILDKTTAADPDRRFTSAMELRRALQGLASATTVTTVAKRPFASTGKAAAMLAALTLVCGALVMGVPRLTGRTASPDAAVVGVLVFNNTGDAENDYLASGMTDVLISDLAGAPGLTVVPRTALPGVTSESDVPRAIKALGLTHVVVGGIQRSGETLRAALSLVGSESQTLLWSAHFDGALTNVLRLEERISSSVLQALARQRLVTGDTVAQARDRQPTSNADAFGNYAHGRALLERGDVAGNLDRALAFFERAVERDPSFARAHAAIGETLFRKYNATKDPAWVDRARAAMLDAVRLDPNDVTVAYSLAVIDHGTGKVDEAIATLNSIVARHPANDDAHRLLGRIYSERNNFDLAIDEFRKARDIRPDYPATLRQLGLAYYDKGLYDEAIASFTRMAALQPDNSVAYQGLGTVYHAANQLDQALVAYTQANKLAPRATTYSNIGTIHYNRGEYAAAIAAYRQAIALQPQEAATHRNLADTLLLSGDRAAAQAEYERAIDIANAALQVNPRAPRLPALIAFCLAKLGRYQDARTRIAAIVAEAPDDNDAAYKFAVIEAIAGRREQALARLQRALQLGYSRVMAGTDRDLDSLKPLPAYQALFER